MILKEELNTSLIQALEQRNPELALKLLEIENIDVNETNEDGVTPLMVAIEHGYCALVSALLEEGVDVNAVDQVDYYPLLIAFDILYHPNRYNENSPIPTVVMEEIIIKLVSHKDISVSMEKLKNSVEKRESCEYYPWAKEYQNRAFRFKRQALELKVISESDVIRKTESKMFNESSMINRIRPSQQQVSNLFQFIYLKILNKMIAAHKNNKKLVILVGENHFSPESYYINNIILEVGKISGISQFLVERDNQGLMMEFIEFPELRVFHSGQRTLINVFKKGMKITPIDLILSNESELAQGFISVYTFQKNHQRRDEMMAKMIQLVNEDSIVSIGNAHLHGILKNLKQATNLEPMAFALEDINNILGTCFDIAEDREENIFSIEQIEFPADYSDFSGEEASLALDQIHTSSQKFHSTSENVVNIFCPRYKTSCIQWNSELIFSKILKQNMIYFLEKINNELAKVQPATKGKSNEFSMRDTQKKYRYFQQHY